MEVKSLLEASEKLKAGFPSLQADIAAFLSQDPAFLSSELALSPKEQLELKSILVSIILVLASKAKSKQDRVDIL